MAEHGVFAGTALYDGVHHLSEMFPVAAHKIIGSTARLGVIFCDEVFHAAGAVLVTLHGVLTAQALARAQCL